MGRSYTRSSDDLLGPETFGRAVARRDFLRGLAAAGAGGFVVSLMGGLGSARAGGTASAFPDGVKAGDPGTHGAVIWSRVAPPLDGSDMRVLWTVGEDVALQQVVRGGVTTARGTDGHMVKVEVRGLAPDRWYYYRFEIPGAVSTTGRLRTAPRHDSRPDRLRYCFASCQQRNASYYVAHRAIAEENVDFLMHLGDYIYVSDTGDITLDQYRRRWRIFHTNSLLQELHAKVPVVAVWDDGEFYNGVDRTGDPARLAAARKAFFEHMPVRGDRSERIYRSFRWGRLAEVFMIDVRQYSDVAVPSNTRVVDAFDAIDTDLPGGQAIFAPDRTALGPRQRQWLKSRVSRSAATWRLVGSGIPVSPIKIIDYETQPGDQDPPSNEGLYVSTDDFDNYQAERREILELFRRRDVPNVIFNSGQTHVYFASELQPDFDDPQSPVTAFDFVTGSLTADPPATDIAPIEILHAAEQIVVQANAPAMKYMNIVDQGYALVDVTPEETIVDFRAIDTFDPNAQPFTVARFRVVAGGRTMERLI
jgi:alkaline phosphatase D